MKDPVAAYFEKLPQTHKRQFTRGDSGASFNIQMRLNLACELADGSVGRLLDCASGTGEITCALLKSSSFSHTTLVDISRAMLQNAKELLSAQITNTQLELIAHLGRLEILLRHLKSMLTLGGRIILQTTLTDHVGTRGVSAVTARREPAQRGYHISWFSRRDIAAACAGAGLRVLERRRHSLGMPFGHRLSPWANFQLEKRLQNWAGRHGADAICLLAPTAA